MLEGVNTSNLSVDENGRVVFSGVGSGIDAQGTVDKIIAARRIPVDTLETRISTNELKITALNQLKTNLNALKDSLAKLYGSVSFGNTNDVFESKQAFAVSSRLDGATPAAAANLVGVTTTSAAAPGSHDIQILRTATAHKVSSDARTSTTTALGFADGDSFTINDPDGVPRTITVNSGTTLGGLRDAINAANKGTTATGVSASIVSVSATEHYLLLTKNATGVAMTVADVTGTPLASIGILTGAAFKNELQVAQTARMYVDGVLDRTNTIYESNFQSASTVQVGSTGTLNFGATYGTVAYTSTDTLATLATNITAAHADLTATIVTDGAGVRLEISGLAAFTITESGGGSAITDLGINNKRKAVERTSNTVSDLFNGVTLNLFQAEAGTNIKIDIEQDLNQIKTAVAAFVDAFNAFKIFLNGQRVIRAENAEDTDLTGVLISSSVLEQIENEVGRILNSAVDGLTGDVFKTLPQLALTNTITTGISYVKDPTDPLLVGTLEINDAKLDEALLNKAGEFRQLLTFGFTSGDSRVSLLAFNGDTTYNATGYTLNIQPGTGDNLFAFSEQADNAYWTTIRGSISADGATAPNGTMTAEGLIGDATNNTHQILNTSAISVTAGQTYIFSTYAKKGASGNDGVRLAISNAGFGADIRADFDLNTGTIVGNGAGVEDSSIENVGNGWYRISVTATATATGNGTFERYARPVGSGSPAYLGDDLTVDTWFWGAQLETAPTAATAYDDTAMSGLRATITANIAGPPTAPNGTATADEFHASTDNNTHFVFNTTPFSVTSGQQYEYATYVFAGARDRVRLSMDDPNEFPAGSYAEFDLAAGTVLATGAGADSAAIEAVPGHPGWYRVGVTSTAISTGGVSFSLYAMDAVTGLAFTGDGPPPGGPVVDLYFWDQRIIPVSSPTSYVQTTTAAVTGAKVSANIDGASTGLDDGSATVTGNSIVVNTGNAKGLRLFFDGFSLTTAVQLDFTVGLGAQLFFEIDQLLLDTTDANGNKLLGPLAGAIDALTDQNTQNQERVEDMLERLEVQRQSLLERFIAMEVALATASRIMESLRQTTTALLRDNN